MTVRLPPRKLHELQDLIRSWVGRKSCVRKELESLVGKLAHAARVVKPGKTFMRRLFEVLGGARLSHHHIRINSSLRSDILWWDTFLATWNGSSIIPKRMDTRPAIHIWTDASGTFGCGARSGRWLQLKWPEDHILGEVALKEESITLKELIPIILACAVWGNDLAGRCVTTHCDNQGTVALVNSGYSRVSQIMHLLRCLFFIRAHFQIELWAVHVPGVENTLADAISRNNVPLILSQLPGLSREPSTIPLPSVSLLTRQHLDWTSPDWTQQFSSCFRRD